MLVAMCSHTAYWIVDVQDYFYSLFTSQTNHVTLKVCESVHIRIGAVRRRGQVKHFCGKLILILSPPATTKPS